MQKYENAKIQKKIFDFLAWSRHVDFISWKKNLGFFFGDDGGGDGDDDGDDDAKYAAVDGRLGKA